MERRYYYRYGNSLLNLKSPVSNLDYIEISEQKFNELSKPKEPKELTEEEKALIQKNNRIAELHKKLEELDYVGVKIATGRATREEYADKIALMSAYARELNLLEENK